MQTNAETEQQINGGSAEGFLRLAMFEYQKVDRCSSHRLGLLKQSPAHLRFHIDNPSPTTDAMRFGSAVHCYILEPGEFKKEFVVAPKCDKRTTVGKETWAAFQLENPGKTYLTADDMQRISGIAEAIQGNFTARALIESVEDAEICGFWTDRTTGVKCKMRIDARLNRVGALLDLKTTSDASRREFERSIFRFGYHRQAAMYLDGNAALGCKYDDYTFIAVESEAPFALAVYRLSDEVIELGRKENAALMHLYAICETDDEWLGYPDMIQDISIPAWAKRQIEEDNAL